TNVVVSESNVSSTQTINIADQVVITDADASDAALPTDYIADTLVLDSATSASAIPSTVVLSSLVVLNGPAGTITYDRADFNWLDAGQSVVYTFSFESESGDDGAVTQNLTLTITGENDLANIAVTSPASTTETDSTAVTSFSIADYVTITDADYADSLNALDFVTGTGSVSNVAGASGPVGVNLAGLISISPSGVVSYDRTAFNWLDSDQTLTYTVAFDSQSGDDAAQPKTITFTINGQNDVADIVVTNRIAVTEEDVSGPSTTVNFNVADQVVIADADTEDSNAAQDYVGGSGAIAASGPTPPSGVASLASLIAFNVATGAISYDRSAFNWLDDGESVVYTVTFDSQSGDDGPVAKSFTFTISGANDQPFIISSTIPSAYTESGTLTFISPNNARNGTIVVGDADDTDVLSLKESISGSAGLDAADVVAIRTAAVFEWSGSTGVIGTATGATIEGGIPTASGLSLTDRQDILNAFDISTVSFNSTTNELTISWIFDNVTTTGVAGGAVGSVDLDFLAAGETLKVTFPVTVVDDNGAERVIDVPFTFTGTNDAPTTSGSRIISFTEGSSGTLSFTGTNANRINFTDPDLSDTGHTFSVTPSILPASTGPTTVLTLAELSSFFSIPPASITQSGSSAGGNLFWNFSAADSMFDFLGAGQTLIIRYTVSASDGTASGGNGTVTVTITGTNDAPVITTETGDSATETLVETNIALTATDTLTVTDLDLNGVVTADVTSVTVGGTNGGLIPVDVLSMLSIASHTDLTAVGTNNGKLTWSFNSGSQVFDFLAVGESIVLTYVISATDGTSSDTQTVVITITGSNDAPSITAQDLVGGVTEGNSTGALTDTGTLSFSDVDLTDTHSVSSSYVGTTHSVQLGTLTATQTNYTTAGTGGLITWNFSVNDSAVQFLGVGDTVTETYQITLTDGESGGTITRNVVVTIVGTNDAPTITVQDLIGAVTEGNSAGNLTDTGTLSFSDVDLTDTHAVSASYVGSTHTAQLGTLTAVQTSDTTAGTGGLITWNFSVNDSAVQFLAAGETISETYQIMLTDNESGGTITRDVVVTITGTNDAPDISGGVITGAISEGAEVTLEDPPSVGGSLNFTDADTSDRPGSGNPDTNGNATLSATLTVDPTGLTAAQITAAQALSARFAMSLAAGASNNGVINWTFDPLAGEIDFLGLGQVASLTFAVTIHDGNGGSDTQNVTINITGANDIIQVGAGADDATGGVVENGALTATGTVDYRDPDFIGNPIIVTSTGGTVAPANQGTLIATPGMPQADGTVSIVWSYTNNSNLEFLADGETRTQTFNIQVLDQGAGGSLTFPVTITITGTNDRPVISVLDVAGDVIEANGTANLTDSGAIAFTDADSTDTSDASVALFGTPATTGPAIPPGLSAALANAMTISGDVENDNGGTINWNFS
ncbi:MAG: beta strand repeat-containing protein, partial [Rhizobiaceae bacterium]